jgi:hypothetical protein
MEKAGAGIGEAIEISCICGFGSEEDSDAKEGFELHCGLACLLLRINS